MDAISPPAKGWQRGDVELRTDGRRVQIELTELGARRLLLSLALHTNRYGPEVTDLLAGLTRLLIGVETTAIERSSPHGPGCTCLACRQAYPRGEQ
jgi:hypothetical protein